MATLRRNDTLLNDERFLNLVDQLLDRDLCGSANEAQRVAVTHSGDSILQIVAGPGSGKTTVLVLRALRHVFVNGILPEQILITTFTRKAARELRTRWLDWGNILLNGLSRTQDVSQIDINRCRIDTLDSIIHAVLTEFRVVGTLAPVLADTSASHLILKRRIFRRMYRDNQQDIDTLLARYTFEGKAPRNQGEALKTTKQLLDRLIQDRVNLDCYALEGKSEQLIAQMLRDYHRECLETNVFHFATLSDLFIGQLSEGHLSEWTKGLRVLLIDEYQDTNPLQEAIYFSLISSADLTVAIVGDDDQSMYRFRGGSVELFTDFASRCMQAIGRDTFRVDMVRNFRSRPEIVSFFNDHISCDPGFQSARITPAKPLVKPVRESDSIPVLGMFRPDEETLANDLARFLKDLSDGKHISVGGSGQEIFLSSDGAIGDIVFLSHSIEEIIFDRFGKTQKTHFPGQLRSALESRGIPIFNPRGRSLRSIPDVQKLLGLVLLSVDVNSAIVEDTYLTSEASFYLNKWRRHAQTFVNSDPSPSDGQGLLGFLQDWQTSSLGRIVNSFPQEWPILEIVFKLVTWIPGFQSQPEHQVWLEAITRIIASAAMASPYGMHLLQNTNEKDWGPHVLRSRQSFIRDALVPIAENEVEADEDIMPSVPRNRLQLMTIHQAKGLEFPLVIVDVGSRFKMNHPKQRFLRFPDAPSNVVKAEDDVEPFLNAPIRGNRSGLDRTFDDLVRLYYVAYSRPHSVLLLIGNEKCLRYGPSGAIPNIALGWNRDENWPWRQYHASSRRPVKIEPPFWEM